MSKTVGIFGFGYCAQVLATLLIKNGHTVWGTSRNAELCKTHSTKNLTLVDFKEHEISPLLAKTDALLICIAPGINEHDPVLQNFQDLILKYKKQLQWVGYLSSTGVYGDHQGEWVDETSELIQPTPRAQNRITAESAWLELHKNHKLPVMIFRLSGIYGPGRNAVERFNAGKSSSIYKAGQYFSRIHVDDISYALQHSIQQPTPGEIFNLSDDKPAPSHEVDAYAAKILNLPTPELIPFEDAELSSMGREFYMANRKVSNAKIKKAFGMTLKYPTFNEGLNDILREIL